jgi:hypothetical protein
MTLDAASEVVALYKSQPGMTEIKEIYSEACWMSIPIVHEKVAGYNDRRKAEIFSRLYNHEVNEQLEKLIYQSDLKKRFNIEIESAARASNHYYVKIILDKLFLITLHKSQRSGKLAPFSEYRKELSKNNPPLPAQLNLPLDSSIVDSQSEPKRNSQCWAMWKNSNDLIFVPIFYGLSPDFQLTHLEQRIPCREYKESRLISNLQLHDPFEVERIDPPAHRRKDQSIIQVPEPKPRRKKQNESTEA